MIKLGYVGIQAILLVMFYGFNVTMPLWVMWFPTIILAVFLLAIIIIFVMGLIVELIT